MSSKVSRSGSASSSIVQDLPGAFPGVYNPAISSEQPSLQEAIHARRADYVESRSIRLKVGTWNVASFKGTDKDIGAWFVDGNGISEALTGTHLSSDQREEDFESVNDRKAQSSIPLYDNPAVDLYLLGLQEIVDINSATEALRPYTDPGAAAKWKAEIAAALSSDYVLVAEQQLLGLLLLVYASERIAADVNSVSTTSVGTGLMGVMGNKGAVTTRFVLGDTTRVVFVNSHLAAGADKAALERRNWDYTQIMARTKFDPVKETTGLQQKTGESIDDADFAFWVGDLNYRIADIPPDDIRRLLLIHARNDYDLTPTSDSSSTEIPDDDDRLDPSDDPASLQTTINSLLSHDELSQQIKLKKAFHEGWQEGQITFLPTYKYDRDTVGVFDSSEKQRAPSWCDRIVFRSRRDRMNYTTQAADEAAAKIKDEDMKKNGIDQAAKDEELLYDYEPDADELDEDGSPDDQQTSEAPDGVVVTSEGFADNLKLETYTAHQRIMSSDHKPLHALFSLTYDAIVPDRKAQVQQEVARELDKAENDGRPCVTVVVDKVHRDDPEVSDEMPAQFEGAYFGHVRYGHHRHRGLTIANTGRAPATVMFVDRPVGAGQSPGLTPAWLEVTISGRPLAHNSTDNNHVEQLEPGESCNVDLEMRIMDPGLVRSLNDGTNKLDDILVLRVQDGRDHFIPVYGKWQQSTIGRSIDKLIRIPEGGIRKLQRQHPDDRKAGDLPVKWSAPRELFRLTEALESLTEARIAEWEMTANEDTPPWFTVSCWPFDGATINSATGDDERNDMICEICKALDEDTAVQDSFTTEMSTEARLGATAAFTVEFIRHISDGIITSSLWAELETALGRMEHKKDANTEQDDERAVIQDIVSQSPPHSISFVLVTSTLDRIIGEICNASRDRIGSNTEKSPLPTTPIRLGSIRRRAATKDPYVEFRHKTTRAIAAVFADAMVKEDLTSRPRHKSTSEERKIRLVELFIADR